MHQTSSIFRAAARGAALLAAALALGGCASQGELRKRELAVLAVQLPGNYANPRQALTILRLTAPLVGDQVFYVRETAADDVRRVIGERIWSLTATADARIVGVVYQLDEPARWRAGADNPELFRSLLLRDLRLLSGCELVWQQTPRGFSGASAAGRCRRGAEGSVGRLEQSWLLEGDQLAFSEQPGAAPDAAGAADSYYRFQRQ